MPSTHSLFKAAALAAVLAVGLGSAAHAQPQPQGKTSSLTGIGRTATPAEVRAWDIDVRPDFKGLPKGKGSVQQGEVLWEAQCASCHGSFGEMSDVFTPLAGGVTAQDVKSGRVDSLLPGSNQPQRTTLMKVSTLSTLWDYIHRAMPWNAPKSLSADDVYAVTAYILNLNNVLPGDYTLSDSNIRDVQAMLPNRNGMTTAHAMWPGKELGGTSKVDAPGSRCMSNCGGEAIIKSFLPDYARNAHGNLADQLRTVGPVRGINSEEPPPAEFVTRQVASAAAAKKPAPVVTVAAAAPNAAATGGNVQELLQKNACLACHGMDTKLVGPAFRDIANKYKDNPDAQNYLSGKIRAGGQGVWGAIPMPAQALSEAESNLLAQWIKGGMAK